MLRPSKSRTPTPESRFCGGQAAKPVLGADGTRVPLLRPNFRPQGEYVVSFVYMHAGGPLGKNGTLAMALPRIDIPIAMVEWEVFVPEQYAIRETGGNVIDRRMVSARDRAGDRSGANRLSSVRGRAVDARGAVLPGVAITLEGPGWSRTVVTAGDGRFAITGVPAGAVTASASLAGFRRQQTSLVLDPRPRTIDFVMQVGSVDEAVAITGEAPVVRFEAMDAMPVGRVPSENIVNLQRRAEGVLPIRIDVPRAGTSHRFVKPLVVDQAAMVTLKYKRR